MYASSTCTGFASGRMGLYDLQYFGEKTDAQTKIQRELIVKENELPTVLKFIEKQAESYESLQFSGPYQSEDENVCAVCHERHFIMKCPKLLTFQYS